VVHLDTCLSPVELDLDPFCDAFLTEPHSYHRELREAGAVVWLSRYRIYAVARHAEVSAALQNWDTFCSGRGGGLADFAKEAPWRPPSIILEADPPAHTRTRAVLAKVLSRPALQRLRARMEAEASSLLDNVLSAPAFDAIAALAQAFPLRVFPDAVGITRHGRENLLPYGEMAFNAFGPRNARFEHAMSRAAEVGGWIVAQCRRSALSEDGFGAEIYAEADAGAISEDEAGLLVRSLLTAGLDTTIQGIAHGLHSFCLFPDQWRVLREKPSLVRNAFEETIRFASPVQTFFRTTTQEVTLGGYRLPEGHKVLLFLAAANRDPRRWDDPDIFSVQRSAAGHVGFGTGIHQCVGQMVARLEAETLLNAMLPRVAHMELLEPPRYRLNNTLRNLASLQIRVHTTPRKSPEARASVQKLQVASTGREALGICCFDLIDPTGAPLPAFEAGAHLDIMLPGNRTRQYSICSDPADNKRYRLAVLRTADSRGGSVLMHELRVGDLLEVSQPKNRFPLAKRAGKTLLLAGGVGITPLISMAYVLWSRGAIFELHYCARSAAHAAFAGELRSVPFAHRVQMHYSRAGDGRRLDIPALLKTHDCGTQLYVCGPQAFIVAALSGARSLGWPAENLHSEMFSAAIASRESDSEFEVELARSGRIVKVPKDRTITEALRAERIEVTVSCEQGVCGTCITTVLRGTPDHRDSYLTAEEKARNDRFTPCCSRSRSSRIVVDL